MVIRDGERFQAMEARLADLLPRLNERDRRLTLAAEAKSWGRGGASAVHDATGVRHEARFGVAWPNSPIIPQSGPLIGSGRREVVSRKPKSLIRNCWIHWTLWSGFRERAASAAGPAGR
jgi:hypothetical protein